MARQFDVWRTRRGGIAVIVQSDLLDAMRTRVVAPLLPLEGVHAVRTLNPEVRIGGAAFVLMPQLLATLTLDELGERVGSVDHMRDAIVRAIDMLLAGV
jgi:toxin CcdB